MGGLKILQNFALRGMGVTQLGIEPPPLTTVSMGNLNKIRKVAFPQHAKKS